MANEIKLKRGSGSNPSASDLVVGEVALRTDNGKLFTKKDDNSVTEIGSGISDGDKGDITISSSGATFTIDNGVVTSSKLADNACTSAKILDGAVGTSKLGGSAVTNAKVASDAAIAGSKISPDFGSQDITTTGHIDLPDDSRIKLGTGDDLQIYHDGSNSYLLDGGTGSLLLATNGTKVGIITSGGVAIANFNNNSSCQLFHAGSRKIQTTSSGIDVTGEITTTSHVDLPDDAKLKLGTGDDLEIYHNGTNSFLDNSNGNLEIRSNEVRIKDYSEGDNMIYASRDGEVRLYFAGSEKLNTTTSGIDVTGNIVVSGTVDGRDLATDGSKLDGIAAGATNVSNTNQLTNGAGFITSADGGNAATLDSIDSSQFLRSDENDSMAGNLTLTGNAAGEGVFVSIENSSSAPAGVHLKSGHGNWSVYNSKTIADHLEFRDESSNTTVMTLNPSHDLGMGDGTNVRTQIVSDHSDAANAQNRRGFHTTDGPALCHGGGGNAGDRCFEAWSAHGGQAGSQFAKKAFQVNSDGSVLSKNNSFGQISDEKLKQDLVDSPSQWNDIKAVKVKKFRFKEEVSNLGEDKAVTQIGVVAQDLEAAGMNGLVDNLPDVIDNVDQGTVTKSVKYSVLYMKAIKALQEAMTRIETLESEVATLKAG